MDYYRILNLQREPFSNSPEPEFFFQSEQHLACLQKLELAIRLRRGLNIVIGDVGLGKTTMCREIIRRLSGTDADHEQIETYLIMDPSFSSALELLNMAALLMGASSASEEKSEWQLKEDIKKYLFQRGVEEGKTVVLIIDEGQKLSPDSLEVLREFLNYETNEYKLLQIVIFAQKEFNALLSAQANFADRVNQYHHLLPLSYLNTKRMIEFRISQACPDSYKSPSLYSLPALWAVYLYTRGYPRRIITLCHQTILAMIIQNRTRVGFSLVHSCAARVSPGSGKKLRPRPLALLVASLLMFPFLLHYGSQNMPAISPGRAGMNIFSSSSARNILPAAEAAPNGKSNQGAVPRSANDFPESRPPIARQSMLGKLVLKKDLAVSVIAETIYGRDALSQMDYLIKANPHIRNREVLSPGEVLDIPARADDANPLPPGAYWVQTASFNNLAEAFEFISEAGDAKRLLLVSARGKREGGIFAVLLKDGFSDEETADSVRRALPAPLRKRARVVSREDEKGLFF